MKSASEVLKARKEKLEQKIKENQEQISKELLEFEKTLNKYENDLDDTKPYITIPLIIRTDEVKDLLRQNGYIIDRVSDDIKVNTTRVYLDKESYNMAVRNKYTGNKPLNTSNDEKELYKGNLESSTSNSENELETNVMRLLKEIFGDNKTQRYRGWC